MINPHRLQLHVISCAILALLIGTGCSRTKKNECEKLRTFFNAEVHWQGAPRQADMSQEAQAENWRWRSERAKERASGARALALTEPTLAPIGMDLVTHYEALAQTAAATAEAWGRGDNTALNASAAAFDSRLNETDRFLARIDGVCR